MSKGCSVCRSRKIKCDKNRPSCQRCMRLGVRCPGYDSLNDGVSRGNLHSSVEDVFRDAGIQRRRLGSCHECRRVKGRCSRARPSCHRCQEKGLSCHYPDKTVASATTQHEAKSTSARVDERSKNPIPGGIPPSVTRPTTEILTSDWLYAESYPHEERHLKLLVSIYFDRVAPLRCLGFIHKPSFLHTLDHGSLVEEYGEPLIFILSALGSHVYCRDKGFDAPAASLRWAETARRLAMADIACPSITTLMTFTLVCEHALLTDQHAVAFVMLGCCYRVMRLLDIDQTRPSESAPSSSSVTAVESQRRLFWSCYILDSILGAGVDKNLIWADEAPPEVPLPCTEQAFVGQLSCVERRLPSQARDTEASSMTLQSHIIYLMTLRTRVLRLIRKNIRSELIYEPGSPFLLLIDQLEKWHNDLPSSLAFSDLNVYVQRELHTLGAYYMMHLLYHSTASDLTRISLPGYDFPLAESMRSAPEAFRGQVQERCRFHADATSRLVKAGIAEHGRLAFDDPHCSIMVFESTKIQIVHTATTTIGVLADRERAADNIRANLKVLEMINPMDKGANTYCRALRPLLDRFGFGNLIAEFRGLEITHTLQQQQPESLASTTLPGDIVGAAASHQPAEVVGPSDAAYLSNLAPFRLAKSSIQARAHPGSPPSRTETSPSSVIVEQAPIISPMASQSDRHRNQDPPGDQETNVVQPDTEVTRGYEFPVPSRGDIGTELGTGAMVCGKSTESQLGVSEFRVEEYSRLAAQMSNYLTWDLADISSWTDLQAYPS